MIHRGEIWWASLPEPAGSGPGHRRPVLVVQAESFNRSKIGTVVVVAITTNLKHADAPGNVLLPSAQTDLPSDSVANVSQVLTVDQRFLTECVGKLPVRLLQSVEDGLRLVLDL
ncbi:MAG: type II toxin-antitoxin system PemK/MazF family toxin [Acidobacteriota bacterium]